MVQWSPDTPSRPEGGGYEYNDSSITGFSLDHLSGPGCGAEGDVPVLPTVGAIDSSATDSFSHSNESAEAGEYQVALENGVTAALTATTRTGMADFTFPSSTEANLIFKLDGSQNGDSATSFTVVSDTEVQGSATSGNFCNAGNSYTLYFDMQFSQPFSTSGTFSGSSIQAGARNFSLKQPTSAKPATVPASKGEKPDHPVYHGALAKNATNAATLTGGPVSNEPNAYSGRQERARIRIWRSGVPWLEEEVALGHRELRGRGGFDDLAVDADREGVGIDRDARNLLRIIERQMNPGLSTVGRTVDAVAHREVRAMQPFARGDVNDVGV